MNNSRTLFLLAACFLNFIKADEPAHPHLHKEVRIVGYHGPTDKHIFKLFRGAEILEMIDCNITTSPSELYSNLPRLKKLHLENNTYHDVDYETVMHGAHSLEEFYFINIKMKRIHIATLGQLPKLRICVIRGLKSPAKTLDANILNGTVLEEFEFSNNVLETIDNLAFNGLSKLEKLNLADNKLKSISKEALTPLKNLKVLNLKGNKIEKFSMNDLPELPNLEEINLSENPVNELKLDSIEKVAPKLRTLRIVETAISEAQVKELKDKTKTEIIDKGEK
ncbi:hypothetical protein HHI36_019782 [Cryptolaemus montrouzieri]|uniref:Uncharacterized protein n=1 Tax=Cryptolaemus montrouzieri TaxID=559131 RepID=A0ABD2N8C9_9CUCU